MDKARQDRADKLRQLLRVIGYKVPNGSYISRDSREMDYIWQMERRYLDLLGLGLGKKEAAGMVVSTGLKIIETIKPQVIKKFKVFNSYLI